jgi:hypothetical protein
MSQSAGDHDGTAAGFTRREVLAGAAATAATVATTAPASAQSVDPNPQPNDPKSHPDMVLFVLLSAALTGIAEAKLAPGFRRVPPLPAPPATPAPVDLQKSDPGSDPVDIKKAYFVWLNDHRPAAFENLLRLTRESQTASDPTQALLAKLQFEDGSNKTRSEIEAKYLARSIVLMWYLGAWYDPVDLEANNSQFTVISPAAYTQAWALRIAQAHPMGFSEMQFGYWHRDPNKLRDFIGKDIA